MIQRGLIFFNDYTLNIMRTSYMGFDITKPLLTFAVQRIVWTDIWTLSTLFCCRSKIALGFVRGLRCYYIVEIFHFYMPSTWSKLSSYCTTFMIQAQENLVRMQQMQQKNQHMQLQGHPQMFQVHIIYQHQKWSVTLYITLSSLDYSLTERLY